MRRLLPMCCAGALAVWVTAAGGDAAWATEGAAAWRPAYDVAMKWVNFLILAGLLVRFGRAPLMNFLNSRKNEMLRILDELETKKSAAVKRVAETQQRLDRSNERFVRLTERIVGQGEARKTQLIEEARRDCTIILDSGNRKIQNRILQARRRLRNEMVDDAFALAMEKLETEITATDDQRLFDRYMESL
jgi:F-type H+-transporting ATPase subunit b